MGPRDREPTSDELQVDKTQALSALDGNHQLLRELANIFCEDAPIVVEDFERAVSQGKALEARRAAHSIKGLASTFFAKHAVEIALHYENEAAHGRLDSLADDAVERLRGAVESLAAELRYRGLAH